MNLWDAYSVFLIAKRGKVSCGRVGTIRQTRQTQWNVYFRCLAQSYQDRDRFEGLVNCSIVKDKHMFNMAPRASPLQGSLDFRFGS